MNAMLEQFYLVPTFRYGILQTSDNIEPNLSTNTDNIDDNVLHQVQKMFSYLDLSEREDYIPNDFCFSYKDIDVITFLIILG